MAETETQQIVIVTELAQTMAKKYLAEEEQPQDKVLRLEVKSGGCSGFSYEVSIDAKRDDDVLQHYEGLTVAIDPVSKQFLGGSQLDYVDDVGQAGFKFSNPNARSSCGCGSSFDV